jgi:outer membrane protein TolC
VNRKSMLWVMAMLFFSAPAALAKPLARLDGDLTLARAIRLAARQNLELMQNRIERRRIALGYAAATGKFIPQLTLGASYDDDTSSLSTLPRDRRLQYGATLSWSSTIGTTVSLSMDVDQRLSGKTPVGNGTSSANHNSNLTLSATQPLLKGAFRTGAANTLAEAKLDIRIQRALFVEQLNTLLASVENAYWQLAFAQLDVKNKLRGRARAKKQYQDTKENIRRGILADAEIFVVEENYVFFEQELVKSQQALALARRRLAALLQLSARSKLRANDDLSRLAKAPLRAAAIRAGVASNPTLQAELLRVAKNRVQLAFQKNQALPSLDLQATFKLNGLDPGYATHLEQMGTFDRPRVTVGLFFSVPLSFRAVRARVDQSKLSLQKQLASLKAREQQVRYDIGDVVTQMGFQRKRLQLAQKRLVLSRKKLAAEIQKYKNGISTLDSIVRFQRELDQTTLSVQRVQLELHRSRAKLMGLLGRLHKNHGITVAG